GRGERTSDSVCRCLCARGRSRGAADPGGLAEGLVTMSAGPGACKRFDIVTLFPEMFVALTASGITRRAADRGLYELAFHNPRDQVVDAHRTVDDRPYGGGPGMVMMAEPLEKAIAV